MDSYGLPQPNRGVLVVGWHAAAQPNFTAVCNGQFLLHPESNRILDPMAPHQPGGR
jgi:hypothetical protein